MSGTGRLTFHESGDHDPANNESQQRVICNQRDMEFRALGNHDLLNLEQFGGLAVQADGLSFNDRTFVPRDCSLNLRRMVVLQTASYSSAEG